MDLTLRWEGELVKRERVCRFDWRTVETGSVVSLLLFCVVVLCCWVVAVVTPVKNTVLSLKTRLYITSCGVVMGLLW